MKSSAGTPLTGLPRCGSKSIPCTGMTARSLSLCTGAPRQWIRQAHHRPWRPLYPIAPPYSIQQRVFKGGIAHETNRPAEKRRTPRKTITTALSPAGRRPVPPPGPIGSACNFTGSSGNIQLTGTAKSKLSFPQYGAYTIAAWFNVDSLFTGDQYLVGKGDCNIS